MTEEIQETWDYVASVLRKYEQIESMHDFRIVGEGEKKI